MGKDKKKEKKKSKDWKPKKCEISPFVWSCIETVFIVEKITSLKKKIYKLSSTTLDVGMGPSL